jgi:VWFA-related protein
MPRILRTLRWLIGLVLVVGLLAPPVHADGIGLVVQRVDAAQFPTVRAYVSVATANGIPITGLDAQAFDVQEDGKPVEGMVVEPVVDSQEPIATALVIDVSGSMTDEHKLDRAKEAANAFIDALGPADRMTVVSFGSQVKVVQDYTADKNTLKRAIDGLAAGGNTLLYDAVAQTVRRQATQNERRKPVLVLTDGEDTASSVALETSIAAAVTSASPVYNIGLGSDVNKEILGQIASGSGGQALFVADPADLKATFLSINDQLRRQYVLRYISKLPADNRSHGLAVQAAYAGQQTTGLKSFMIPAPPSITVSGLDGPGAAVGVQHVTVDASGGAQLVQLLVEDQVRGSARSVPAAFDWDTARETPGSHRVVVRITDMQGASTDKPFTILVAAPAQATVNPTPAPISTVGPALPVPAAAAAPVATGIDNAMLIGVVLLLFLIAACAWYLARGNQAEPARQTLAPGPQPTQVRGDITEEVGTTLGAGVTFVRPGRGKPAPQARLMIARRGEQSEIVTRESVITIGRDQGKSTVFIDDSLASREHVRIWRDGAQFSIEDLKSKNGTQLNGEPLTPETRRPLKNHDRIGIGDTVVTFIVDSR